MCFGGCIPGTWFRTRTQSWQAGARYVYDTFSIIADDLDLVKAFRKGSFIVV